MAHAIIRLDKVKALYNGTLTSAVHTADLDNGSVVMIGGLHTGEREIFDVVVPATANLTSKEVFMVATPEVMYLPLEDGLENFYNKAGEAMRLVSLTAGDIITVTAGQLTGTPVVGKYVIPANGSVKLAVADDLSGNTRFAGEIIEATTLGFNKAVAYAIRVVKN